MSTDSPQNDASEPNAVIDANAIRAKIFGDHYVEISRTNADIPWTDDVHAINWFNTRSLPLYNFYNLIASRSVIKVGGRPLFKGKLTKTLFGDEQDARSVLLVVKYPSPLNFSSMLENTYFKTVSVLRAIAVSDFTFCLSKAVTVTKPVALNEDSQSYLIHHFRGDKDTISQARAMVDGAADDASIELVFASVKSHSIGTGKVDGELTPLPNLIDGVLLFSAPNDDVLESFVVTDAYKKMTDHTQSSFIGTLRRLM